MVLGTRFWFISQSLTFSMYFWPSCPYGWFPWKVVIQDLELDRSKTESSGWISEKWEGKVWGTTQGMSMGAGEGFKVYAKKWRDLAGRVHPPLSDRELVDMFLGTLSGPFFNHLIGSSSAGFNELIMTGERVESSIKSGKIQRYVSSSTMKKPFTGKQEVSVVYDHRNKKKLNVARR